MRCNLQMFLVVIYLQKVLSILRFLESQPLLNRGLCITYPGASAVQIHIVSANDGGGSMGGLYSSVL
jgi:hypothetical protein